MKNLRAKKRIKHETHENETKKTRCEIAEMSYINLYERKKRLIDGFTPIGTESVRNLLIIDCDYTWHSLPAI